MRIRAGPQLGHPASLDCFPVTLVAYRYYLGIWGWGSLSGDDTVLQVIVESDISSGGFRPVQIPENGAASTIRPNPWSELNLHICILRNNTDHLYTKYMTDISQIN